MVIRGEFNERRPYLAGFLSFGFSAQQIQVEFVIDTGSDVSLLGSDAYEGAGLSYDDFDRFPSATSAGFRWPDRGTACACATIPVRFG